MDGRLGRYTAAVPDTPPVGNTINPFVIEDGMPRRRKPQKSISQNPWLRLVFLVVLFVTLLLFVSLLILLSTDNIISRLIEQEFSRRQHQQLVDCSPCPPGSTTSADIICCESDEDISATIRKVLSYLFGPCSRL